MYVEFKDDCKFVSIFYGHTESQLSRLILSGKLRSMIQLYLQFSKVQFLVNGVKLFSSLHLASTIIAQGHQLREGITTGM